jgi:hypothetical protein
MSKFEKFPAYVENLKLWMTYKAHVLELMEQGIGEVLGPPPALLFGFDTRGRYSVFAGDDLMYLLRSLWNVTLRNAKEAHDQYERSCKEVPNLPRFPFEEFQNVSDDDLKTRWKALMETLARGVTETIKEGTELGGNYYVKEH